MPLTRCSPAFRYLLPSLCATVLLIALFSVPYDIPVRPSLSDSYIFGYNNRAGVVIVLLLALLAAFFVPAPASVPGTNGKPLSRSTLAKAIAITMALGIPIFLLTYRLDGFIESVYTVDRTRLLLEGHTPYRDFEFCYGLLALYGPAFLVKAFHLTVPAACDLFFLAAFLLGIGQLYLVVSWSGFPPDRQREVFLIVFLIACLPSLPATTTAYTLPRFLTGGLCAMLSHRLLLRNQSLLALLLPIPGVALTLLISPEMSLAYAVGISLYLLRFGSLRQPRHLAAYFTMLAGVASILLLAARGGAFITLASFSGGAFNYPIIPAPHILLFLFALAVYAAYLAQCLRTSRNPPLLALGSIAPAMLPAALGRCDSAHVMFNGILVLIIALFVCSTASRPYRLLLLAVVGVFFLPFVNGLRGLVSTLALAALPNLLQMPPGSAGSVFATRLTLRLWGPGKGSINLARMKSRQSDGQAIDVRAVFGQTGDTIFAAPFAFSGGHTGPYHSSAIDEGYFLSVVNMVIPAEVTRKIAELDSHPERPLLIPAGAEFSCIVEPANARNEIRQLFTYPYRAPAIHRGDVIEPLCVFIRTHYAIAQPATPENFYTNLWQRSATSRPSAKPSLQ